MKNTSHFVLWITVLSIGFFTMLLPVQAQTEWVEIKRGSGTVDGGNPSWTFFIVDLSAYSSGNLAAHISVEGGTGISRTGGKCWGGAQFAEEGFFKPENKKPYISNITTRILQPNQTTKINGNFSKPTKFILGVISSCRPELSSKFDYVIYIKNGKKVCAALPPTSSELSRKISELGKLTDYCERSRSYHQIHEELQKRGIGVGFFQAASDVTADLCRVKLGKTAQDFLDNLSKQLAGINARYATELLQTGKLEKENKSGFFTDPNEIDAELVRREQVFAGNQLSKSSKRTEIIAEINAGTNAFLARLAGGILYPSMSATNEIIKIKRKTNPKAGFDYGSIDDRMNVGNFLTAKHRNNNLVNSRQCK